MKKTLSKLLVVLLAITFVIGGGATVFAANAVEGTARDFAVTYENAKAGTGFVGATGTFVDADSKYTSAGYGKDNVGDFITLGGAVQDFSDFSLSLTLKPEMKNEWSKLRIWFRIWDNKAWLGDCVDFRFKFGATETEQTIAFATSEGKGSDDNVVDIESARYNYIPTIDTWTLAPKEINIKIVCKGTKGSVFIDDILALTTSKLDAAHKGHFEIQSYNSGFEMKFPVVNSITVLDTDLLTNYIVKFETNGGSAVAETRVADGEKLTKPSNPAKEGKVFVGWYKDSAFATEFNFETEVITQSTTLYAKWRDIVSYTVKFNTQSGSAIADVSIVEGSKLSKPTDPTREGYVFAGWYKDTECKVEYDFASDVSAELTLYAKWTKVAETPDSPINWTLIGILIGVVVIGIAVSVVLIIKNKKKK